MPWKEASKAVLDFLKGSPEATVDEVSRFAADVAKDPISKESASKLRRNFRAAYAAEQDADEALAADPYARVVSLCARCGAEGHWISQCSNYVEPRDDAPEDYAAVEMIPSPEEPVTAPAPAPTPPAPLLQVVPPLDKPLADVGRTRTMEGTIARRKRLNELLDVDPNLHPLTAITHLRMEFGIALDFNYVYETTRLARETNGLPPLRTREDTNARAFGEREHVTLIAPEVEAVEEKAKLTADEELEWLAVRLSEVIRAHGLSDLNLRTENGELAWDYDIRVRKSGRKAL